MKILNERSMLVITALTLGLVITWLIASDEANPRLAEQSLQNHGVVTSASLILH